MTRGMLAAWSPSRLAIAAAALRIRWRVSCFLTARWLTLGVRCRREEFSVIIRFLRISHLVDVAWTTDGKPIIQLWASIFQKSLRVAAPLVPHALAFLDEDVADHQ